MQRSRSGWWQLLVLCVVAVVCRLGMLWFRGDSLSVDVDAYLEIARQLVAGNGFSRGPPLHPTAYRPPLYPLLLAAVFKLGGSTWTIGLVQVVLVTIAAGLTWRVGQLLRLGSLSLVAGLLVAVDPVLLQYTALPMTEVLCATLVILWCWIVCEWDLPIPKPQTGRTAWLLQGACLGFLCLCRPAFLAGTALLLAWLAIQAFGRWRAAVQSASVLATFRPVVWSCVGLSMVVAPWVLRNALVIGKPTPATTHGGYTLLLANNPVFYREVVAQPWGTTWQRESLLRWQQELEQQLAADQISPKDEIARDAWMYHHAVSNIRNQPGLFVQSCVWRAIRFWDLAPWQAGGYPRVLVWGVAIFYGLISCGILAALWRLNRLEWNYWSWLLVLPLTLWLTHWVYWTDMRMRAPVIPILALLAARGWMIRPVANDPPSER